MENYNHFVVIAAGENPDELMKRYESGNEKTVVFYKKDAEKLRSQHIEMAKAYRQVELSEFEKLQIEDIIETLEEQTIEEFWEDFTSEQDVIDEDNEGKRRIIEIDIDEINSKNIYDLIISDLKSGSVRDYLKGFLMEVDVIQKDRTR